jgi:hypothetical protein
MRLFNYMLSNSIEVLNLLAWTRWIKHKKKKRENKWVSEKIKNNSVNEYVLHKIHNVIKKIIYMFMLIIHFI